ncbi:hypothetical protein DM01DRAFT_1389237 [Hesseltinella vesiculosa]|uniref:Clathrin light chain n=1 Tax=Hesseltinella vesiculosa TaxID=101127 RepID=A0A1X2GLC6_9FUNG|nr:hypothetical protein DM01DRAFT_1389237 [Hesseltinella vesiculosa]
MSDNIDIINDDPTADFLARERAALGEDADFFENDMSPMETPVLPSPSVFDATIVSNADLDGTPFDSPSFTTPKESMDVAEPHHAVVPEEEPETVKQWMANLKELIDKRDKAAEETKKATIEQAHQDIDKFYEDYNDKKQKAIEANRRREEEAMKKRDSIQASANVWQRVVEECGTPTGDTERMKEIMQSLKKDTNPPGSIVQES